MFDKVLRILQIINMLGLEYTTVVSMTRSQRVQFKLCFKYSRYFECSEF